MRGKKTVGSLLVLLPLVLAGCDRGIGSDTVAQAGDFRLGVDDVAELIGPALDLPNDEGVIQAVAEFWVDYTLLAWTLNQEGELDRLDLGALVQQETAEVLVRRLRDSVIQVDTTISEEELREIFETERPADEVRARHVLLMPEEGATQAQRDSLQALAGQIRDRARAGEDFAQLAEEYSDDTGSAVNGGDLGYFGRGMMVPPFDSAAFAMSPGDVSDVIETDFGYHVILVEDRTSPEMDELPYDYREQYHWEIVTEAERFFLDQVMASANVQVQPEAAQIIREIAANPTQNLSSAQASRAIATFEGGSYTAGDLQQFVRRQPAELVMQIEMATDPQLEGFSSDLVRDELLLREAASRGIQMRSTEIQQIELGLKDEYMDIGEFLGFASITPEGSESLRNAVSREVMDFLQRVVRGEQDLVPLGALSIPLRNTYNAEFSTEAIPRVVSRVEEIRSELGVNGLMDQPAPPADAPDVFAPDEPSELPVEPPIELQDDPAGEP